MGQALGLGGGLAGAPTRLIQQSPAGSQRHAPGPAGGGGRSSHRRNSARIIWRIASRVSVVTVTGSARSGS